MPAGGRIRSPGHRVYSDGKQYIYKGDHTAQAASAYKVDDVNWSPASGTSCCQSCSGMCKTWQSSTRYHIGDHVSASGKVYMCAQEHVSAKSFGPSFWIEDTSHTTTTTACCSAWGYRTSLCACASWAATPRRRPSTAPATPSPLAAASTFARLATCPRRLRPKQRSGGTG